MQVHLSSKGISSGLSAVRSTAAAPYLPTSSNVRSLHTYIPRTGGYTGYSPFSPKTNTRKLFSVSTEKVFKVARVAFDGFIRQLTKPGLSHPITRPGQTLFARVNESVRPQSIQQRLSFSARHTLSTPRSVFLPHASPASRNVTHVGLGLARNFSTARPIFQHLVQNVPVTGRTLYEADWNIERKMMKDGSKIHRAAALNDKENGASKASLKLTQEIPSSARYNKEDELDIYFRKSVGHASEICTVLLVPLAPAPTARLPLSTSPNPIDALHLLPLSDLEGVLSSHRTHSLRVSSLFSRLDTAHVWEKGATFTAYGHASGLCTILRVEFHGWTEHMVKSILGEAGKGWCRLVEINENECKDEESELESGMSSLVSSGSSSISGNCNSREITPPFPRERSVDPAASFILPTLDFSSSFIAAAESTEYEIPRPLISFPPSPALSAFEHSTGSLASDFDDLNEILSDYSEDAISYGNGYSSDESESWAYSASPGGIMDRSMIGFSSTFLARSESNGARGRVI